MYFYIDESGHTGTNLFDENQPTLYYGVLSSRVNLDVLVEKHLLPLRKKLDVERLHAAELGNSELVKIIRPLIAIQKKYNLRFDIYQVEKSDHAAISFFDQVFDQGLNPAVTWTGYWTPMRYILLLKVVGLFDEVTLKKAWEARINKKNDIAEKQLIEVCQMIRSRVSKISDARSRQLITDALLWAENNPKKIQYNINSKKELLSITPNIIGFQGVMHGIASRLGKSKQAAKITVDQQTQFNKAQKTLADFYSSIKDVPFITGSGLPEMELKNMPTVPIIFESGTNSAGLELVDIYLWVFKRFIEKKSLAPELNLLISSQLHIGHMDEISIRAIANRWEKWFKELPEPTKEQESKAKELLAIDEERRLKALKDL